MRDATFIYALIDPRTREIRYIGKADKPVQRLRVHLCESRTEQHHCARWIRSLAKGGLKPKIQIIDEVSRCEWQAAEAAYIAYFKEEGCDLTNISPGGDGIGSGPLHPLFGKKTGPPSPEHRAKISAALKGKKKPPLTPVQRARRSLRLRGEKHPLFGKKHSAEARAKMKSAKVGERNQYYGKQLPPEHRAKISASLTGEKHPMYGKKHSTNSLAKMSAAQKGKAKTPEWRANIGAALRRRIERMKQNEQQQELKLA